MRLELSDMEGKDRNQAFGAETLIVTEIGVTIQNRSLCHCEAHYGLY